MRTKRKTIRLIVSLSVFAMLLCLGCGNAGIQEKVAKIDKEETYLEAPGELSVVYTDIEQIKADATDIVKVSVTETRVELLEGFPQTHTFLEIQETLKGKATKGDTIEVIEEGGYDNKVMGGIPQMKKGSEYVLFLKEVEGKYWIRGAFQGRFIIREGYVFQQATEDVKLKSYQPLQERDFFTTVTK